MPMLNSAGRKEQHLIQHGTLLIPLQVIYESRRSVRVSIGKRKAYLRLPRFLSSNQSSHEIERAKTWITQKLSDHKHLALPFQQKKYCSGDKIEIRSKEFSLEIVEHHTNSARLYGNVIQLRLIPNCDTITIKRLISRSVAKAFYPWVVNKVNTLNQSYFKQEIKGLRLKYNLSNWGSCSSNGHINLSTRLFFVPDKVFEYVILHELTHLIEMNHSPRFYDILREVAPDYKTSEQWLKSWGHLCDF